MSDIIKKIVAFCVCLCIVSYFGSTQILAHTTGQTVETAVGNSLIDIGYDVKDISVGQSVVFDFNLTDLKKENDVPFTDVWVKVQQGNQTVFASGIHRPQYGKTGMIFTFPTPGDYTISTRFQNNDTTLAETSFTLPVKKNTDELTNNKSSNAIDITLLFIVSFIGILVGAFIGIFAQKHMQHTK